MFWAPVYKLQYIKQVYVIAGWNMLVDTRPAEKFWVITPQTSLKFLGQNLFGDQFWGQSEAGKV